MGRPSKLLLLLSIALLGLFYSVRAQGDPEVAYTTFHNFPSRLFFFDDTSVRLSLYLEPSAR